MTATDAEVDGDPRDCDITPEEGRRMFDEAARKYLGISGEEFIRRLDAGEFANIADTEDDRQIVRLALMSSFGRKDS